MQNDALSEKERQIIRIVNENPFLPQQEIASRINLSRSATANLLSGLQNKGYILGRAYVLNDEKRILCIGGANIDHKITLLGPHQPGTSNPVRSTKSMGGVMRNIAENLGRLGSSTQLMTLVGSDRDGVDLLKDAYGIFETRNSEQMPDVPTGFYHAVLDTHGSLVAGYADMEICNHMNAEWILAKRGEITRSPWVVADCNLTKEGLTAILDLMRTAENKVCIIGVSAPKMSRLPDDISGVRLVICNVDESQARFQTELDDPKELCRMWLEEGAMAAVVTAGRAGYAYGETAVTFEESVPVPADSIIDVTGAGDAFSAGVIFGIVRGETLGMAVRLGAANARLTIQSGDSVVTGLTKSKLYREVL